ncbi:MAG: YciI family protein [Myxococcota bacterium]
MQYVILVHETPSDFAQRKSPPDSTYWTGWAAYSRALQEAKVIVGGNALQVPEASTVIRIREGARQVQDGPFADSKEQLGGYFVIDVPDLDTALEWAARCPSAATGGAEVRPVLEMGT